MTVTTILDDLDALCAKAISDAVKWLPKPIDHEHFTDAWPLQSEPIFPHLKDITGEDLEGPFTLEQPGPVPAAVNDHLIEAILEAGKITEGLDDIRLGGVDNSGDLEYLSTQCQRLQKAIDQALQAFHRGVPPDAVKRFRIHNRGNHRTFSRRSVDTFGDY